jgi:hypothetical protein
MVLVRQKGRSDCAVAVVATIAQVPYEAVLDRLVTGLTAGSALPELVMWRTLQDVTQAEWCMQELWKPWPQVGLCSLPDDAPTVVLLERPGGSRHYVAVRGDWVYDPLLEMPVARAEYPDRDSWVVTLFHQKRAVSEPLQVQLPAKGS